MLDYTLSVEELATLREAHRKEKKKRLADRLKVVYLLGSGWTAKTLSEALLVDEDTIRNLSSGWTKATPALASGRQ